MIVIHREEIRNCERRAWNLCLTDSAANASNLADLADPAACFMVVACADILSTVWHKLDDMVRADCCALAAPDAGFLIDNDIAIAILGYSVYRTD